MDEPLFRDAVADDKLGQHALPARVVICVLGDLKKSAVSSAKTQDETLSVPVEPERIGKRGGEPARVPGVYSDANATGIASCNAGNPLARIYP
jgi:hypothetical protein